MKKCNKCKKEKDLDEFFKSSRYFKNPNKNKDRMSTICKECTYKRIRININFNKEKYRELGRNWTLKNPEKRKIISKRYWTSPKGIYRNLVKRNKTKVLISQGDFIDWYIKQEKICVYCGIPQKLVEKFAKGKLRARLTINRLEPKGNYEKNNILLACGVCNFIKSDVCTPAEMSEVGKIINKKWQKLI